MQTGRISKLISRVLNRVTSPEQGWNDFYKTLPGILEFLLVMAGSLSFIRLVRYSYDIPLREFMILVIQEYNDKLLICTKPIEVIIIDFFLLFGIELYISESNRHLFMILSIYIIRHAFNTRNRIQKLQGRKEKNALLATFYFQIISFICILTIVFFITNSVDIDEDTYVYSLFIIFLTVMTIFIYDILYIMWHSFFLIDLYNRVFSGNNTRVNFLVERIKSAFIRNFFSLLCGVIASLIVGWSGAGYEFAIGCLVSIATIGLYWMINGIFIIYRNAILYDKNDIDIDSIKLAASIIKPMFWGLMVILISLKPILS